LLSAGKLGVPGIGEYLVLWQLYFSYPLDHCQTSKVSQSNLVGKIELLHFHEIIVVVDLLFLVGAGYNPSFGDENCH
jgi:hypothetical protein